MSERTRIVLAEDESLIRIDLEEILTELGYDVVGAAADGATAVRISLEKPTIPIARPAASLRGIFVVKHQTGRPGISHCISKCSTIGMLD